MCRAPLRPAVQPLLPLLLLLAAGLRAQSPPADIELLPDQSAGREEPVSYAGFQVLRVQVADNRTAELLRSYESSPGVHLLSEKVLLASHVDIAVSPEVRRQLTDQLTQAGVPYTVSIDNMQAAIDQEIPPKPAKVLQARLSLQLGHPLTWSAYHRLTDHNQYIDFIRRRHSRLCRGFSIGRSTEGRDIRGVKCGYGEREIWIDGGIHAREWISPAVVSYLIGEFSERSRDSEDILDNFTLYIIPILNPDGYEYTHTTDRLWRKTRSKNAGSSCIGVDANRNFDISWGTSGTSKDPCSTVYGGPHPFSEPEARAIRDFVLRHKDKLEMFITIHSYSELIFVPYAFTVKKPDDYDEVRRVAQRGADAILATSGLTFDIPTTTKYNKLSGVSDDWAKVVAGVPYTYTFELRDKGQHGFMLPADQIEPSGLETAAAVKAMIRALPVGPHPRGVGPTRRASSRQHRADSERQRNGRRRRH